MFDSVCWLDDHTETAPEDLGRVTPDGSAYRLTFAATLEGDADEIEQELLEAALKGADAVPYMRIAYAAQAAVLRDLAARARAAGCLTPEAWEAHQARLARRGRRFGRS